MEPEALQQRIIVLENTFRHNHVNNGQDDTCRACGLDLRDPVHVRIPREPKQNRRVGA